MADQLCTHLNAITDVKVGDGYVCEECILPVVGVITAPLHVINLSWCGDNTDQKLNDSRITNF